MTLFHPTQPISDIGYLTERKDINGLIQALSTDNFEIQSAAAKAIGTMGPAGVERLIKGLETKNHAKRLVIIGALAEIRNPGTTVPLMATLNDNDPEVRWAGAIALGEIGDERAIPPLIGALKDPDKYVRYGASFALSKIGWKPVSDSDKALLFYGMQEWGALLQMGTSALPVLEMARKDREVGIRMKAVELLGAMNDRSVVPALISSLADENSDVRWMSVLVAVKGGVPPIFLPRGISRRPRIRKNPSIAALLNFLLPGQGYNYLGKWWGIMIFQLDVTITLWLLRFGGESLSFTILMPIYILIAAHAAYIAIKMPDM